MTALVVATLVKVTGLLLVGLLIAATLRRRAAALRHWVLTTTLVCALAVPALQQILPAWTIAHGDSSLPASEPASPPRVEILTGRPSILTDGSAAQGEAHVPRPSLVSVGPILLGIWFAGSGLSLGFVTIGLFRLRRLRRGAALLRRGRWYSLANHFARQLHLPSPVALLQSHHPTMLVTWGLLHPQILLPAGAADWPDDRIAVVLLHELAHVKRRDWIVQLAAEWLRCCCWFNPLTWVMCVALRRESEQACDDAVLGTGIDGPIYAGHLLDLARTFAVARRSWSPELGMAHLSTLERRVTAMMNTHLDRRPLSRLARTAVLIALAGATAPIASLAAQTTFASLSGTVSDPTDRVVPNVQVVLTNAQDGSKHEVRTDRTGRFDFVGLPPADYVLQASLPGFETHRRALRIDGQHLDEDIQLQLGSLEETITIAGPTDPGGPSQDRAVTRNRRTLPACASAPVAGEIGGNIRAPFKVRNVPPVYPAGAAGAAVEHVVVLNARIGTDGFVKDVEVVGGADPAFAAAATEAVRQWEFDETLLNCIPVEVRMRVTASFRP